MKSMKLIRVLIVLSVVSEIFVLYSIFDVSQKMGTASLNLMGNGQYMVTLNASSLYNYWIYEWKLLTIPIPLILAIILIFIYIKHNKNENSTANTAEINDTITDK